MVNVIRLRGDAPEGAAVFSVYKTKDGRITGNSNASAQASERSVAFCNVPNGLPVQDAFDQTVSFCEKYGVSELYIRDPENLWPEAGAIFA